MLVLMFRSWVLNEIWIIDLSSALIDMLLSLSKVFLFSNKAHLNSGVRLLLELYCVTVINHVAFFTICAKLLVTMAFTSDLNKKYWRTDRFGENKAQIGGFSYPYSPPLTRILFTLSITFVQFVPFRVEWLRSILGL